MWRYRLFLTLFAPVLAGAAVWRLARRTETPGDLGQRLGRGAGQPGALWLHGASNGELTSARALVEALRAAVPDLPLIVTANTVSARDMVAGWGLPRVTARLAPLDFRWALARFLAAWRPQALIILENELWPNRIVATDASVICVGARMSARSARRWLRQGRLAGQVMRQIRYLTPQDAASGDRFRGLGLPADRIGPVATLKASVSLPAPPQPALAALRQVFDRADTLLAASTHEGEEAIVLQGFQAARAARPGLRLILAPRHPRRGDEVAGLIDRTGLPWARRSTGEDPAPDTAVYLADTLGEMPLWYALAGITLVGGSLCPRGGHTPYEPAQFGSAILHGPDVANFTGAYAALDTGGGAIAVADADQLAQAVLRCATAGAQNEQAARATAILAALDTGDDPVAGIVAAVRRALAG